MINNVYFLQTLKSDNYFVMGYSRGTLDERNKQNNLLLQESCHSLIEDPDQSNALCPALQFFPEVRVILLMTTLNSLRGSTSCQLGWLKKWLLRGHHIITLDGVMNSIQWPESTALIAVLSGHNPRALHAPSGRPSGLSNDAIQIKGQAIEMHEHKTLSSSQCARRLGIARSTYYRYLNSNKPLCAPSESEDFLPVEKASIVIE
jgi:hypothetical protein